MKNTTAWGIDLTGRIMWHHPWPVDENHRYCQPTEEEKEEIYGIGGSALKETYLAFKNDGGDTGLLIEYLNQHIPSGFYRVDEELLLDSQRWYTNEFYFYFIMFTKKIMSDYNWHYSKGIGVQLSEHHKIYEIGHLHYTPFGKEEKDVTNSVIISIMNFVERITHDVSDIYHWLDLLAQHKTHLIYSKDISTLENYWICSEFIFFFYEFVKIITNINNMLTISYDSVSTYSLRFFSFMPEKIVIESLKMIINKSGKMFSINTVQKQSTAIEVTVKRKKEFDFKKMHYYHKSINLVVNKIIPGVYARMIKDSFNISLKPDLTFLTPLDSIEFVFSIAWKKEKLSPYLSLIFILIITGIAALFLPLSSLNWIKYCILSFLTPAIILLGFLNKYIKEMKEKCKLEKHLIESINENLKRLEKLEVISEELINEKIELENKVSVRTKKLYEANERLKELDKIKSNFFDNISHELKTPLTLITAPLDSIRKKHYGISIKYDNPVFTMMHTNCKRLIHMITMQLHYSKLQQGQMNLIKTCIDMVAFAKAQFVLFELQAYEKKIKTNFICPDAKKIMVSIDITLFEMVFANLLSNAYKFSRQEGTIHLTIRNAENKEKIYIMVSDTGIGIPEEKQKYIFERFHQIESNVNRNHEGSGLGLALTKEIIELHGGNIRVESQPGKGSIFTIELPVTPLEYNQSVEKKIITPHIIENPHQQEMTCSRSLLYSNQSNERSRKKKILLIEDNADMCNYIGLVLEHSYCITFANNGVEALDVLKDSSYTPDLIISDIMMPLMDGYTFHSEFLKLEHTALIPFIFLTARGSQEDKIHGVQSGAIDYITKPFYMEELLSRIKALLDYNDKRDRMMIKNMKSKLCDALDGFSALHETRTPVINEQFFTTHNITIREKEIIYCMLEGLQDKEIASKLTIATRTVSKHLANVYEKSGAANRLDLMTMVLKNKTTRNLHKIT